MLLRSAGQLRRKGKQTEHPASKPRHGVATPRLSDGNLGKDGVGGADLFV